MVTVVMTTAGVMSALMNNVAVAALMLPVVMDIARADGTPAPSRLLMPLAYGSLLGGLTTQIGTPPNILVTEALRDASPEAVRVFRLHPAGPRASWPRRHCSSWWLVGRHLLPDSHPAREPCVIASAPATGARTYALQERLFHIRIPP
jgi:hypothetical protein